MLRKGVCIGLGYFSQFHLEAWSRLKDVEIIAVCDFDKDKLKQVASKYGIKNTYTNVEEMFVAEQPDFVDIITPPKTHLELSLLAIKHNIKIYAIGTGESNEILLNAITQNTKGNSFKANNKENLVDIYSELLA